MKLTVKEDQFVMAFVNGGVASDAYRAAYDCSRMKTTTINNNAWMLLQKPAIKQRVEEIRERAIATTVIDRAGVLALITEIATADASQLSQIQVRCCRHCWGVDFAYQWLNAPEFSVAIAKVLDANATLQRNWDRNAAIGVKQGPLELDPMPTDNGGYGFDVYASPNPECPRCLGEGHVMPVVKDTRKLKGAAKRLYAGFKQTKDGIEIKTRDQSHALTLLAKEYGIAKDAPAVQVTQQVGVNAQGAESVTVIAADPAEASRQYQELMRGG